MNRKDFLKSAGIIGVGMSLPASQALARESQSGQSGSSCVLIPSETAGPFPLDLTANTFYFRQDIRESQPGVQLNQKLRIIGQDNCQPMSNVRVNIWHCHKDGYYSGYDQPGNPGQLGLTYLRGYQITDANGEVEFITIFPGWYTGRICHIHFQVYVSSSYAAISQLTYNVADKNAIYAANPGIYTKGPDPTSLSNDNIFADGYQYQLANLSTNTTTGGYDSFLEVTVQGAGLVGVGHLEKENAKNLELGQNFPNPYSGTTQIPLTLIKPARVTLELWDLAGRKVRELDQGYLGSGLHKIPLDLNQLGLPVAGYIYQVEVRNDDGVYRANKMMTPVR